MNTKDLIIEKTLKLIVEKGTIDISISEIRDYTGQTTGGIYYHFSDKGDIVKAILQKYMVDYIKIDLDKIPLEGSSKNKIHDTLFYILQNYINGEEIEKTNYQRVIYLLTATGYAHDEINGIISQTGNDIKIFLTDLVEDGKRQNEIRADFPTKNIVESLHNLYMGIQGIWLTHPNVNVESIFEKNFEMTWQTIEYQ